MKINILPVATGKQLVIALKTTSTTIGWYRTAQKAVRCATVMVRLNTVCSWPVSPKQSSEMSQEMYTRNTYTAPGMYRRISRSDFLLENSIKIVTDNEK